MTADGESVAERARFRDVFAVGEFRALWTAQVQSRIGDQLARVALAVLVYALTYLPPLLAAPLLSGLADRVLATRRDGRHRCGARAVRNAALPRLLEAERFPVGMSVVSTTDSVAGAGVLVAGGIAELVGLLCRPAGRM